MALVVDELVERAHAGLHRGRGGRASDHGDVLIGSLAADVIDGRAGEDLILGLARDDALSGGEGRDRLHGGSGDDALDGGGAADLLRGGPGDDLLSGGSDADLLLGEAGRSACPCPRTCMRRCSILLPTSLPPRGAPP